MDKRIEMNQETVMKRRYISAPTDTARVKEWLSPLICSSSLESFVVIGNIDSIRAQCGAELVRQKLPYAIREPLGTARGFFLFVGHVWIVELLMFPFKIHELCIRRVFEPAVT